MTSKYIEILINLEKLHRKCYDKLYVQNHEFTEEDQADLHRYSELFKIHPNFRLECALIFIYLVELNHTEHELIEKLSLINFDRYSIPDDTKKYVKRIRSEWKANQNIT